MGKRCLKAFVVGLLSVLLLAACSTGSSGDGDTIKIGANLELSGNVASYGQSILEGIKLAVEEINNDGGIDGKKIEIVEMDNKSESAEAVSVATRLISEEKVLAIIGSATTGNTAAQIDIANKEKVIVLTPSGTSPTLTVNDEGSVNEYIFRTSYIDSFQGTVAANFALKELGVK